MEKPLKTFIIYARDDAKFKTELLLQLHSLVRKGLIEKWDDSHLLPGEEWEKRILQELESSDLVIMLVSAHSLYSDFIQRRELKTALERKSAGITRVIPILVRDCLWEEEEELAALQMLPVYNGSVMPVAAWSDQHSAWASACRDLIKLVTDIRNQIAAQVTADKLAASAAVLQDRRQQLDEAAWKTALDEAGKTADITGKILVFETYLDDEAHTAHREEANRYLMDFKAELTRQVISLKKQVEANRLAEDAAAMRAAEQKIKTLEVALDMVLVKGGTFQMGSHQGEAREKPVHAVTLDDFYIGRYPVTVSAFGRFIDETGYRTEAEKDGWSSAWDGHKWAQEKGRNWRHDASGKPAKDDYPVVNVSWNDAQAYCKWLSRISGKKYGLPTEARWEYAARGGSTSKSTQYAGSNAADEVAWYAGNAGGGPHPVGQKKPNEIGLHDMNGNVWEWCQDWFGDYPSTSQINPAGPDSGPGRVNRGGSWRLSEPCMRIAFRNNSKPGTRNFSLGFRLARSL